MIILGVDIGTTSVKVMAANPEGEEHYAAETTYDIQETKTGYREQNPELLLKSTEDTIAKVIENVKLPVSAFCFSSAMHSVLCINASGQPITPLIIWADKRSVSYAEELRKSKKGMGIYSRCGAPLHAMLPLCKIAWIRDNQPEIFNSTYKFLSIKEYFFYTWFGVDVIDYSIASATGLFDIHTLAWNEEALAYAGISAKQLSKPVSTTFFLRSSEQLSEKFNILTGTPFVIGASDGCLANLNASGLNAKEATLTLGTSGAIRLTVDEYQPDPEMRIFNYILTEQYHVIGGPTNNGGIILEWILEKLYPDLSTYEEVLEKIRAIPSGADGLICVPYFYGERAPVWNEQEKGNFYGILNHHSRDHMARAAVEGIIFNVLGIAKGLEAATQSKIEAVWADGGLTRSDFVVQLISDVFNLPVYLSASSHGVDRGAILLGAYALGLIDSLDIKPNRKKTFYPDLERHKVLSRSYAVFENLVKRKNIFTQR